MKRILIVVDMQEDFVSGSLGFPGAAAIIPEISKKIASYRQAGHEVIFTRDTHGEDYASTQEGKNLPVAHCITGTPGHCLVPEIAKYVQPNSLAIDKPGFGSLAVVDVLRSGQYECVEICGLVSNICVLFAAVLAKTALPEAEIIIDARCTASYDPKLHEQTLAVLAGAQVTIVNGC